MKYIVFILGFFEKKLMLHELYNSWECMIFLFQVLPKIFVTYIKKLVIYFALRFFLISDNYSYLYSPTALPPPPPLLTTTAGVGAAAVFVPNNIKEPTPEKEGNVFKRLKKCLYYTLKSLQGFLGLLQGNLGAEIPYLQA